MANTIKSRVKPHHLAVAFFNADGLVNQIDEVREFVCSHQIDVMLVQETFLKPSRRDPRISNYAMIRNDRAGRLGGTAIYYRRALHCTPLDPPSLTNMEASVCQVSMTGHPTVILASVYLSPTKQLLESDLIALLSLGDSVILAGDFNARHPRWGFCLKANQTGRTLYRLANRSDLNFVVAAPDSPTRYAQGLAQWHNPSVLDIALLKGIALQVSPLKVIPELNSDHRPVLFNLGSPPSAGPQTKKIVDFKKFAELLKVQDSAHLAQIPDILETTDSAKAASLHLTGHILDALSESSREVPIVRVRRQLPEEARELIRIKNAKRRAHDACPTDENRRELWHAQRMVKLRVAELRDEQWGRRLGELKPSHVAYYSLARHLKADPASATPPLLRPNQPPAFEDVDKAECLADSLEAQCSPSTLAINRPHIKLVESQLANFLSSVPQGEKIRPTTSDEVSDIIKGFHTKKAPGPDNITNRALKLLPEQLINLLVVMFNIFMASCIFPDRWKEATVIGIPKVGKPSNLPSSYRPISLLNTLGKVYEKVILNRLRADVEENNLLNNEQFGFRAGHSCTQQAHRLTEHILVGLTKFRKGSAPTGALFFDVAKAFDKVWHAGLIYKLHYLGVSESMVRLLHSYLTNRSFRYRLDGTLSTPRPIRAGVPQGSLLSPLLYALYTSDIPHSPHVSIGQFADDTALFTSHVSYTAITARLQEAANRLGEWFLLWRIEVNPEKSAAILFEKSKLRTVFALNKKKPISLYGKPIPWRNNVKYLGVIFDRKLHFNAHIRRVRNKAAYVLGRLYPMICSKSKLSLRHKVTLYKTCIRPIMTYASVVFAHIPPGAYNSLQVLQNKFMRMATGSPWFIRNVDLHRDLELPTIAQYLKQLSKSYFEKAAKHPNPLVVQSIDYKTDRNDPPDKRRPRHVLDYPDDRITTDNSLSTQVGLHNNTTHNSQRLRRRRRGPRFLTSPGRGFNPRPLGRTD